jgi:hypothetical protein
MTTAEILDIRPAAGLGAARPQAAVVRSSRAELIRLAGLDRLPVQRRLVGHWQHDAEGRLALMWQADIGPVPPL